MKFWVLFLSLLTMSCLAADSKTKVLLVTGGHGFAREPFLTVFRENPQIEFTHAEHKKDADVFDREDLSKYDVVVLYDMPKEISETQKAKFLSIFQKGTGLLVLHHALVSYQHWPDYERIIGGRYPEADGKSGVVTDQVGYQHDLDYTVKIVNQNRAVRGEKTHLVTEGLNDFQIHDEIYWGFRVAKDVFPLITTDQPKSGKPLGWTRTEKKSRVVYLQLGHGPEAYANPNYRRLVAQAIQFVAPK